MFSKEENQVLDKILEARCTCRNFSDQVPAKEDIEKIIWAGQVSPYASIDSKMVTPFRHFFVIQKDDPRLEIIDRLIKEQSARDLEQRLKEKETDAFLQEHGQGVERLWKTVAERGESTFPNPPCMIVAAEYRGARRAERQSLCHMMENMWLKATALNLDFQVISVTENMVYNQEWCDMFGLPVGLYGFYSCVVGYRASAKGQSPRVTSEVHW